MLNYYVKIFRLVAFLVYLLIYICAFCILSHICLWWLVNFHDLIFLLHAFHLTVTYHYNLLWLLCHCFHMFFFFFFANIDHLYIHTHTNFWCCKCSIVFHCFSHNLFLKSLNSHYLVLCFLFFIHISHILFHLLISIFLL